MGSNIKVQRICQNCGNEFTARTTTTMYCSHRCNSTAYKAKKRAEKIQVSKAETIRVVKSRPIEELKTKEFLRVTEVARLIGCSRQNVYSLINTGKLRATNILIKKTIVRRLDLDELLKDSIVQPKTKDVPLTQKQELLEWVKAGAFDITECYALPEIQTKYNISEKALYDLITRNNLPKIKKGWFTYVPKMFIDDLLHLPING